MLKFFGYVLLMVCTYGAVIGTASVLVQPRCPLVLRGPADIQGLRGQ